MQWKNPNSLMMLMDSYNGLRNARNWDWGSNAGVPNNTTLTGSGQYSVCRHGGSANVAWGDGHVSAVKANQLGTFAERDHIFHEPVNPIKSL